MPRKIYTRIFLLGFGEYYERRRRLVRARASATVRSFNVLIIIIIINTREYATFLTLPILFSFLLLLLVLLPQSQPNRARDVYDLRHNYRLWNVHPVPRFKTYSNEYLATRYAPDHNICHREILARRERSCRPAYRPQKRHALRETW